MPALCLISNLTFIIKSPFCVSCTYCCTVCTLPSALQHLVSDTSAMFLSHIAIYQLCPLAGSSLFGGARPRELVLKGRGVDDIAINNLDMNHSPNRVDSPKNEITSEHAAPPAHQSQKNDNRGATGRRNGRDSERKDQWTDHEKTEIERKNWRNDKWKSSKDAKDQRPEPETWRRPNEEPKTASP
ncbi:EUKARYOTIC TRANSLATION INITIATION FACTOR 4B [Salix viminalis]|uniref:EUKARYOTIC TRANSLATION INITIATION FACTOR 4B n=1 Tax=Salix viminalis TaxID=40686 RepID=A0A9Q0NXT5_SALVM|nr:EUKARYOTIC TRANSLATION INITIATION FACTOR 4B [Salix viminalis]